MKRHNESCPQPCRGIRLKVRLYEQQIQLPSVGLWRFRFLLDFPTELWKSKRNLKHHKTPHIPIVLMKPSKTLVQDNGGMLTDDPLADSPGEPPATLAAAPSLATLSAPVEAIPNGVSYLLFASLSAPESSPAPPESIQLAELV